MYCARCRADRAHVGHDETDADRTEALTDGKSTSDSRRLRSSRVAAPRPVDGGRKKAGGDAPSLTRPAYKGSHFHSFSSSERVFPDGGKWTPLRQTRHTWHRIGSNSKKNKTWNKTSRSAWPSNKTTNHTLGWGKTNSKQRPHSRRLRRTWTAAARRVALVGIEPRAELSHGRG